MAPFSGTSIFSPGWVRYIGIARRYSGTMLGSLTRVGSCAAWSAGRAETARVKTPLAATRTAKAASNIRLMKNSRQIPQNIDPKPFLHGAGSEENRIGVLIRFL